METFVDPKTHRPITSLALAEGETRVVGLKAYALGTPPAVIVLTQNPQIAICHQVCHLNHQKTAYNDHYDLLEVAADTSPLTVKDTFFYQVSGMKAGSTSLAANDNLGATRGQTYAPALEVSVTKSSKSFNFSPPVRFDDLWKVHPLNPAIQSSQTQLKFQVCEHVHFGCMIRFCTALRRGGVKLDGLSGSKCGFPAQAHAHHFTNPYDFEDWKHLLNAYVWEAKPPFQPEPMPGFAAFYFVQGKKGVILFKNYFSTAKGDMFGGHIDLWDGVRMGNTFTTPVAIQGHAAFARARKIVFWPLSM